MQLGFTIAQGFAIYLVLRCKKYLNAKEHWKKISSQVIILYRYSYHDRYHCNMIIYFVTNMVANILLSLHPTKILENEHFNIIIFFFQDFIMKLTFRRMYEIYSCHMIL